MVYVIPLDTGGSGFLINEYIIVYTVHPFGPV